jgi:hypothetical protein
MIDRDIALQLHHGENVHYTGKHECHKSVGPRGGVQFNITNCRVTGVCKTWASRPEEFRLPVKFGLYESSAITHMNMNAWHRAADCPLVQCEHGERPDKCWRCELAKAVTR